MKKKVMALLVCMVLSVMMVTPCFAAGMTTGGAEWTLGEDPLDKLMQQQYSQQTAVAQPTATVPTAAQTTVVTPVAPVAAPTVAAPAVTADANTQAIAMQVTYNFVVQQFYGGDHQKAFDDLANYVNLVNACYPNMLQVMQALNASAAQ